jgi:LCP family protein required for cell wall assembly
MPTRNPNDVNRKPIDGVVKPEPAAPIVPETPSVSSVKEEIQTSYTKAVPEPVISNQQAQAVSHIPRKKRLSLGKVISVLLIFTSLAFIGVGAYFSTQVLSTADDIVVGEDEECSGWLNLDCVNIGDIFTQEDTPLKGQDEGRTNFLIIGKDSTASLTDTLILLSYYHAENKIVTVNFPRDLYVTASYPNDAGRTITISERINAVFPFAERASSEEGAGAKAVATFVGEEFGVPVHYWMVTDFTGVEKIVDELGGITVEVDKAFTDCQFPTRNYRGYIRPCPSFEVGPQRMTGERALIYARSRMAAADGGDFARSRRQSIVIEGMLNEIKAQGIFGNINNIRNYLQILGDSLRTNMQLNEMLSFYNLISNEDNGEIEFLRLVWEVGNGFLCQRSGVDAYNIVYCGGAIPGRTSNSTARQRAQGEVQNMLDIARFSDLYESRVVFVGNLSNVTREIRDEFVSSGFENITFNNTYSRYIDAASATSVESATVYIPDPELRTKFNELTNKPDYEFTVAGEVPEERVLISSYQTADIIVWVESAPQ